MGKFISFLQDVRKELGKVAWPTGAQTTRYTAIVIAVSIVVALFLGLLDFGFRDLLELAIS